MIFWYVQTAEEYCILGFVNLHKCVILRLSLGFDVPFRFIMLKVLVTKVMHLVPGHMLRQQNADTLRADA
jgi:hypothetical protein